MDFSRIEQLKTISNDFFKSLEGKDDKKSEKIDKNQVKLSDKTNKDKRKLNLPNFSLTKLYKKNEDKKNSFVK